MRKNLRGHVFNIRFLFTLCLGFAFSETHAQMSGSYTINSAVVTGGSNFQSFTDAVAQLTAVGFSGPVTFNVQPGSGPYSEQVVLNNINATAASPIIFNCNGVTLSFNSSNTNSRAGIKLNNSDYITFDGLVITPLAATITRFGYGFHLLNDADHNTIQNCHIICKVIGPRPYQAQGIVINGSNGNPTEPGYSNCDYNLIQQNTIEGGGAAITLSSVPIAGNPDQYMTGNIVKKNTIINWKTNGIELYYNSNAQVDGNDFTGGTNTYVTCGIHLGLSNQKVAVTNNRIHDLIVDPLNFGGTLYGIRINSKSVSGQECVVANNAIYNWASDAPQYGIFCQNAAFLNVYHNTVSLDDQTTPGDYSRGLSLDSISDVTVMNNIVTVTRNVVSENYGMYVTKAPLQRLVSDHNVFYVPALSGTGIAYLGLYGGDFMDNLTIWRSKTGYDLFSAELDPLYVNASTGDLRPTVQRIDNMALAVGITTDLANITRNATNPDAGCFEFTSAACTAPLAGTPVISPDSVLCQGPSIAMGLDGNSGGNGQTYTWQSSSAQFGTYNNIVTRDYPYFTVTPSSSLYYRIAVTCGATTVYSSPVKILVTTPLNAGTYTINNALPTGGINYNSFSDAARALQCGLNGSVVFNVTSGSGPYPEQMIIPAINTAPNRTVTFNGNGATITYATTSSKIPVIKLNGADYITIDSLNVTVQGADPAGYGYGIFLTNDADHNVIKRCSINLNKTSASPYYGGIIMSSNEKDPVDSVTESNCDYNQIVNNTVNGGYYGIVCASKTIKATILASTDNTIKNNKVSDNCADGIYVVGTKNMVIDSNDIGHPTRTAFSVSYAGIYVFSQNNGLNISKNRIHHLLDKARTSNVQLSGIKFVGTGGTLAQPNMVTNNLMYYFMGQGYQEGLYAFSCDYLKFYHNTVSLEDSAAGAVTGETSGFGVYGLNSTGLEFKDNSIVIKRGGDRNKYCVFLNIPDSNLVANYNNYYMHAAYGTTNYVGNMGAILYPTLSNWLVTRKDSSTVNIDPVYNDIANGDLTPTKLAFENRGFNVGITSDMFDAKRDVARPDIGAIEFTICRQLANPVVTVEEAGTKTIKFSWLEVPNTTGYRVSRDGFNWTIPTSGAKGLNHIITGLKPTDTIGLMVKALGTRADCPEYLSARVVGQALTDGVFVPNTFTPNGDSKNDKFKVYSNVTKSIRWMVFNQWGEKVFESNDIQGEWDGTYKGKPQPIGVYVFVVSGILTDGTKVSQKGTFNLVR
ncbi:MULTISPECIES: right-handed parallel beta-helix repeat-containing protein [Niastella]|uniref:Right-handed parallel beta-helix repeat-containing protein n=1 Tax=Niastella soli TaxID=2821487 RepID=A0ABS3YTX4_9BACT|nr:right-handed parallel beta-helix repeat-containing protein [Niastella soli]MBO9201223.1 right-handed parallel beta-helix repeat-containing protein [Niastella soli]